MEYKKIHGWILSIWLLLNSTLSADAQTYTDSTTLTHPQQNSNFNTTITVQTSVYTAGIYGLSKTWYSELTPTFYWKNDAPDWYQMDKAGHFYSAFHISRLSAALYRQAGATSKQQLLYGTLASIAFQTPIELLDGFTKEYGFSVTDMVANLTGTALFATQYALWSDYYVLPKFSTHASTYAAIRPNLLGRSFAERILKDYNGQTYWLSTSPARFSSTTKWPTWLCISVGYGVERFVSAEIPRSIEMGYTPYRQYYLSFDIDLTQFHYKRHWIRRIAFALNTLKIPAPTISVSSQGFRFYPLYF